MKMVRTSLLRVFAEICVISKKIVSCSNDVEALKIGKMNKNAQ
jgi:hypothetical protein